MSFYKTYRTLCGSKGISPTKAALEMGFSNAAYSYWAKGSTPRPETIKKVADYFGVDVSIFTEPDTADDTPSFITGRALGALIMMPVIERITTGDDAEAIEEYSGEYQYIGVDMVHNNPQEYRVLGVKGDTMYPFFLEGDRAVVHLQAEAADGDTVVAIPADGESTIKKLHVRDDGSMDLVPINAMYPPIKFGESDRIYGKVTGLIRNL